MTNFSFCRNARLWLAMTLAVVAATACNAPPAGQAMPPADVLVETVQRGDLPLALEYPARVAGSREVEVRARVSGIVVERAYREGQVAAQGDLLFRIEPDSYRASYDQARAQAAMQQARAAQTEQELDRAKALVEEGAVSRRAFDEAQAAFEEARASLLAAEAAVRIAKINLDYTEVRAPVSGVASKEAVTVGNLVEGASGTGGTLLTSVVQADPAYVDFSIAEPEYLLLRRLAPEATTGIGLPTRIVYGADCAAAGVMDFADSVVDAMTGTVRARAVFENPDGCLLSGQYLRIELSGASIPDAIAIPKSAVMFTQNGAIAWVIGEDDTAAARPIRVGESWRDRWIVEEGLADGERVVVEGILKVRPGAKVAVSNADRESSSVAGKD